MIYQVLAGLSIIIISSLLTLPSLTIKNKPLIVVKYQSELLEGQTEALYEGERIIMGDVTFNERGNVNMARTINFDDKKLVIFLGCGRNEIRQR